MIVYRICNTYPPNHNPIDGVGAFQKGGRWNSKGTYAVYTASSLALARSELARHVNLESVPEGVRVYEIELPEQGSIPIKSLPEHWNDDPPSPISQRFGDQYLHNPNILYLKVPSVCDPNSFNLVLNPMSVHYNNVKVIKDYPFVL
ncbi:MAG: RES family NAD+ phosphorylase [Cyclobacteriaceae bacterium]